MKYADKIGAQFTLVLGDDELTNQTAQLKHMKTGEKFDISLGENFLRTTFPFILIWKKLLFWMSKTFP